jgi:hypothetical protein
VDPAFAANFPVFLAPPSRLSTLLVFHVLNTILSFYLIPTFQMFANPPLSDPPSLYPLYFNTNPTPIPYQHPVARHLDSLTGYKPNPGPPMDPSAVDFRAFYPYTPNEVKHRKRTTSTQLKTLETIFKRDTKPNGPLRVELAAKLGMTPRGVQVWFQNRRAKEKNKTGRPTNTAPTHADALDQDTSAVQEVEELIADSSVELGTSPAHVDMIDSPESPSQSPNPPSTSPPALHIVTESSSTSWQDYPVVDAVPIDQPSYADINLHAGRRGSLPVNALPHTGRSTNGPPQVDSFDPFARRLSVDASLLRLANNPYAHLARAKNGALFGTRGMTTRQHSLSRVPYAPYAQRVVPRGAPMPSRLDIRRASADSRAYRLSSRAGGPPSPSPLSSYHVMRGSLPEHNLYTVSSRPLPPPIPGPLPSPNFSFGAASTPSMASASSGDSERNSPDSLQSFTFRREEFDEDEGTSASYDGLSRFGSIASVATSDSSVHSSYYNDVSACAPDHEADFDISGRRDSCTSVHFISLMSDLDVNGIPEPAIAGSFVPRDDSNAPRIPSVDNSGTSAELATYPLHPSPASTISPGPGGSPPAQNTPQPLVPISRSSELAFALQSPPNQAKRTDEPATYANPSVTDTDVDRSQNQYFHVRDANNALSSTPCASTALEYVDNHHYNPDCPIAPLEQSYSTSAPYLTDGYSVNSHADSGLHHSDFDFHAAISNIYTFGEAIDPSIVSPMDNAVQNVETFVTYA